MKKLILIYGLIASSFCFGADWVTVYELNGSETQIDTSSIKKLPNNNRLVWSRGVIKTEDEKTIYTTLRSEIDCNRETLQNTDLFVDINDDRISQSRIENPKPFSPPPGSGGQKVIHTVCKAP